jgi:hypothetical protein
MDPIISAMYDLDDLEENGVARTATFEEVSRSLWLEALYGLGLWVGLTS